MFATSIKSMSIADLQSAVWELYKDTHGVRPHHLTDAEWCDRGLLEKMLMDMLG